MEILHLSTGTCVEELLLYCNSNHWLLMKGGLVACGMWFIQGVKYDGAKLASDSMLYILNKSTKRGDICFASIWNPSENI